MNQIDPEEYRIQIEEEILNIIEEKLVNRDMNADIAKEIARLVLDTLHPHMSIEEIRVVVNEYDKYFQELTDIVLMINWDKDQSLQNKVEEEVQRLVDTGKFKEVQNKPS